MALEEAIGRHDATSRVFQRSQKHDPVGWIAQILARGPGPAR